MAGGVPSGGPPPSEHRQEERIYFPSDKDGPLRQGEIITDLIQAVLDLATISDEERIVHDKNHPYAIILTQDCDLEQAFSKRNAVQTGNFSNVLPNVLLCEAIQIDKFREGLRDISLGGRQDFKSITQNKNERFHYLQGVAEGADACGIGLSALGIDFKRHFTIPSDELYERVRAVAKRRTVLAPIYAQHLSNRFASFLARVALPADHMIDA